MEKEYICPILTILKDENTVDFEAMHKLYDRLISDGISAIALLGSCGEFYAQTLDVCNQLVEDGIKYINHRTKVYVGANRMDDQLSIDFANKAIELGADGILLVGPYYMSATNDGLFIFFNKMAKSINGDIIIYNYPERTGYDINNDLLISLLKENNNIVGIKDTIGDVKHTISIIKNVNSKFPNFKVYTGFDGNCLEVIKSGGQGVVGGLSNIISDVCVDLIKSYENDDEDRVSKNQNIIEHASDLLNISTPFMSTFKYIVNLQGITNNGFCLTPAAPLTNEQKNKASKMYKEVRSL
ncbi:dihydrodipicolinate synthase family protein [Bombilactobacillus bombi]|uniref:dihydrodipicolinate synthase family protein n=1 Tax=Bombilactobacillus bombi TaxID=1303590 RepID=UPI0013C2B686|nr:dihydrodipicolinate synthase family protein [Bombilactobacillus bombi]